MGSIEARNARAQRLRFLRLSFLRLLSPSQPTGKRHRLLRQIYGLVNSSDLTQGNSKVPNAPGQFRTESSWFDGRDPTIDSHCLLGGGMRIMPMPSLSEKSGQEI
nr:hypothetical protein [Nocardia sp.]